MPIPYFTPHGSSKSLTVVIHGFKGSEKEMRHVCQVINQHDPDTDIYCPKLPHSRLFCMHRPINIVKGLLVDIDTIWEDKIKNGKAEYERIRLVGSSTGGLFIRKLYIHACGENIEAPFEKEIEEKSRKVWASKVERIILLASMNKGWAITHHLSYETAIAFSVLLWLAKFLNLFGCKSVMLDLRRGAPFITELRAQWLYLKRRSKETSATTIQLLGSIDDLVAPEDNIDLASGADFIYLDVPNSGHLSVLKMDETEDGKKRAAVFSKTITETEKHLRTLQEIPADIHSVSPARPKITDVIFVIHGIRDKGYWTHKIARRIKSRAEVIRPDKKIASETSSYGYFPIIDFLLLGQREKKVHWLMEQYIEALAIYPNAQFSFVGHSNGTYLLTKALEQYECCRFKNVVFASSVVRTDYNWDEKIQQGKVKAMLNFQATADYIVAWAPYFFETWGLLNLGGAGHAGFKSKAIHQIKYIKGGHSAAREEGNWDTIADFILSGKQIEGNNEIIQKGQSKIFRLLTTFGRFGFFIIILICIIVLLGYAMWQLAKYNPRLLLGIFIVFYLSLIIRFLKKA